MDTTMKVVNPYQKESPFRRWWNTRTFIQRRMIRMCLSMLVMVLCFPLYYLGLFGTVEGPLNPQRIGDLLAGMGVTQSHIVGFLLAVAIIAGTWNWVYNLVSRQAGARLSCKRQVDEEGNLCGAAVRRSSTVDRKTGQEVAQYVCQYGHKRRDAQFHAVKKGHASHAIWAIALAFIAIVLFR
jgi:hypothetical protein